MSLRLRGIAIDGFRKFREPLAIDGLRDGLNIIIEPNEAGKSTLLEALRAAFFVRHGTKNQLAQSYVPYGEAIAPEIKVAFEAYDAPWTITKRFLKGAMIEVTGPQGRAQGDEAEARLHTLLGSVRDTSQRGDASTYGALGLLWVMQADALSVSAPGQIVRDSVRATLETEVGSIMGGPAYQRVRDRIEVSFGRYWSPTGQKRERQNEARTRLESAEAVAREAADRLSGLEKTFTDLEATRARLKIIERELADDTDAQTRADLVASREVARDAVQILSTRIAEYEAANAKARTLEDLANRHRQATEDRRTAQHAMDQARDRRSGLADALMLARQRLVDARSALEAARAARQDAWFALRAGEERMQSARRRDAIAAARRRHAGLVELERQRDHAKTMAESLIPTKTMAKLEANDRAVAEARAIVSAGATRLRFEGEAKGILIDGEPLAAGERTITRETRIHLGAGELIVTPPPGAISAEETLAAAEQKQRAALEELGLEHLAAARACNEAAREATSDLRAVDARIDAATPADEAVGLASGAEALKLLVAGLADEGEAHEGELPDVPALTQTLEAADVVMARAEGTRDSAIDALRSIEEEDAPLATAEAGAASDLSNASTQLSGIEGRPEFASLTKDLMRSRETAAQAQVSLEDAKRNARAYDQASIQRKIETIDARTRAATEARKRLETELAKLEGNLESEGGKGLADREAAAREEVEAAQHALQRISEEADALKLLRDTLEVSRIETSARFVGPVASRAKRYIERLLPGSELAFSEDLALEAVVRAGVSEGCAELSRGTQEQLAILTRIAFADMLLDRGQPVSLILDDPLVYSDDERLDVMIEILGEVAQRMQVILLTCRDRAFRHVPGNRLSLVRAAS